MFKCEFCGKESHSKNGMTYHTKRCYHNKDRIEYASKGMKHKEQSKRKMFVNKMLKQPDNIFNVSNRTKSKIIKRLNLGCFNCGWDKTICDLHHIIHRKDNGTDDHNNITVLCPNCHRLAHEGKIEKYTTFEEKVGNSWIDSYYNGCIGK